PGPDLTVAPWDCGATWWPAASERAERGLHDGGEAFEAAHVWPQHRWNDHAPIRLLVVLQHRDHHARQGQPRAVQRVHELRLGAVCRPVADAGAAGLKVAEV